MLNFSFSSVLISILCCNVLIVFLSLAFSSHKILLNLGFKTLNAILLIVFVRLLFPFELPITTNIYFPPALSNLVALIWGEHCSLYGFVFSIWQVMVVIWMLGFLYHLYRYICSNKQFFRLIRLFGTDITKEEPYTSTLKQICNRERCRKEIHIIRNSFSPEPSVYGFRTYYILIPDNLDINSNELDCLLSHEVFHIIRHDLLKKSLVQIICMLYWWNPFCILFQKQFDLLQELQIDQRVGREEKESRINYFSCLLKVAKQIENKPYKSNFPGLSFTTESGVLLNKRFHVLMENDSASKRSRSGFIFIPVCMLVLFSFFFIFEAHCISPENEEDGIELTADNCYVIQTDDGTYDFYLNDEYMDNINSLEYYPEGMIIYYNNGEEGRYYE